MLPIIYFIYFYSIMFVSEADWIQYMADVIKAKSEQVLPDGRRPDLTTETHVYEVEFLYKWPESIGQVLGYSLATGKNPGIIILKNKEDEKYNQFMTVITSLRERGYPIRVIVININNKEVWYNESR